ncbi:unnamed protein product [Rhizoctonia solani]|uniref:SAP domain-containing protein n=1 Tax=Rhizoctonia solani TaxID=456999 RepID=A0A8H2Y153_9AGAM|nr:unnamed protein product [Rhizoctonia solani]
MSFPTRVELENLKRAALQAKCKELGIKANSKSEHLIDMVLERYLSAAGPSKPSTSTSSKKRKADDEVKTRRVRTKVEPQEEVLSAHTSPRRTKAVEVVIRTPARVTRAKGKGKAKEMTPLEHEIEVAKEATTVAVPVTTACPLVATNTAATIIDAAVDVPAQSQIDANDTRIADLELQIRNARKSGDDSSRELLALKAFQNAIQQAFGDSSSSDTLDSMGQLAKLRDIAPQLLAASHLDPDALNSRVEAVQNRVSEAAEKLKQNRVEITGLQERLRQLEAEVPSVSELEIKVRQLQSQFNRIPDSVFENVRPEDSITDSRYTIIRAPSAAPSAGPSGSQRPSSQLSVPEEASFPQNQDQNSGRAPSLARSSRGSRPPLAQKEKEIEETGSRRSIRPSSQSPPRASSSSRARSPKPYSRPRSTEPPTPTRSKGKSRMIKTSLETVAEDERSLVADPFTPTRELRRSPPTAVRKSPSPLPSPSPSANRSNSTATAALPTSTSTTALPAPLAPTTAPPAPTVLPASFFSDLPTYGAGPVPSLPFKLVASTAKPLSEPTTRAPAPSGRVGRTSTRPHTASARLPKRSGSKEKELKDKEPKSFFSMGPTTTNGTTNNPSAPANGGHGFISPERFAATFSQRPTLIDLGRTPGGLAHKTTGRAPPGTPAATNTMYGTEVARDTRFADLPYDPNVSTGSHSWENGHPILTAGVPRNSANP